MKNTIKKHFLGGIAEAVDSSLDGLGTWGKLGVQIIDPTGVTGWKDFGDALKTFQKEGSLLSAGGLGLATLGIIPMFGGFGRAAKVIDKVSDAEKVADAVSDVSKAARTFKRAQPKQVEKILEKTTREQRKAIAKTAGKKATKGAKNAITGIEYPEEYINYVNEFVTKTGGNRIPPTLEEYLVGVKNGSLPVIENVDKNVQQVTIGYLDYINNPKGNKTKQGYWTNNGETRSDKNYLAAQSRGVQLNPVYRTMNDYLHPREGLYRGYFKQGGFIQK